MWSLSAVVLALGVTSGLVRAASPTPTVNKASFVSAHSNGFRVNGSDFRFVGTNAYWLQALNTDEDIDNVLAGIAAANISVVRTWAFNDVPEIPENGTWLQHIAPNGTLTLNEDETTGLPKLDRILTMAQNHGIYILPVLTNNYNPLPGDNITSATGPLRRDVATNNSLPRNYLSNDYGGMDAYVRAFNATSHDAFFTDERIVAAFESYTTNIVTRYVNHSNVLAWELGNDVRCNSSIAATPSCNTNTITLWHDRISRLIQSIDQNHLVSSGTQGFFCADCEKLFQNPAAITPPAQPSSAPGARKRFKPLTNKRVLEERKQARKKTRAAKLQSAPASSSAGGVRVRGRWMSTPTRRQEEVVDQGVGFAFDGSSGVDSEDILSIPQIGFSSFQLFPDQNQYAPDDPNLPAFNNTLQAGLDWIRRHGEAAAMFGKPIILGGFGLVTQDNAPFFVPFNTTIAPFANDQIGNLSLTDGFTPYGVTDAQRDDAYTQWLQQGIVSGLAGIIQYQWAASNLTAVNGSAIVNSITQNGVVDENGQQTVMNENGISPSDGYSIAGQGQVAVQDALTVAAQSFAPDL
ncbi:Glycoside hydrolase family 5 protein [Mycena kentingensis (nom. inval.)]|nr:Glycoside hydrolase family 5 protein [Mycena kentingensis (nom. inval.)]